MKLKFLHKRKEEKQTEKEAFSLPKFIIERSRAIEIVFLVLVLISALMAPFVEINYDLTESLPSTVQSKQGLDLMEEKFGYPGTGRIMIDDVSLYEAKAYKDKIEALDGVDQVMWLDTSTSRDEKDKPYSADYLRTIKGRYYILHIRRLWILFL